MLRGGRGGICSEDRRAGDVVISPVDNVHVDTHALHINVGNVGVGGDYRRVPDRERERERDRAVEQLM